LVHKKIYFLIYLAYHLLSEELHVEV